MAELCVPSSMEYHAEVLRFVEDFARHAGADEPRCMKLLIAADELFTNIAQYGYPDRAHGTSEISAEETDGVIILTFADDGIPYNPLLKPDPDVTLSAEERKIGGLGIYMVKKSMDAMEYVHEDGKNKLTLKLRLR